MKGDKEFEGTLSGFVHLLSSFFVSFFGLALFTSLFLPNVRFFRFDEYVNMVLEDVVEYDFAPTGERLENRVGQMLLNGNNVCLLVPGGQPQLT